MTKPEVPKAECIRPLERIATAGLLGAEFAVHAVIGAVAGAREGVRIVRDRHPLKSELSEFESFVNNPESHGNAS